MERIASIIPSMGWTIIAGVTLTAGDILLRDWFHRRWQGGFWIVFGIYIVAILSMMLSFFDRDIAIATVLAVVVNVVVYMIAAHFFYGDEFSLRVCVGIGCGLAAMALLELE